MKRLPVLNNCPSNGRNVAGPEAFKNAVEVSGWLISARFLICIAASLGQNGSRALAGHRTQTKDCGELSLAKIRVTSHRQTGWGIQYILEASRAHQSHLTRLHRNGQSLHANSLWRLWKLRAGWSQHESTWMCQDSLPQG